MDEYLRDLERRFTLGLLTDGEKYRLQERYCQIEGHCPARFVIQRITEELDSYIAHLRRTHFETVARLTDIFNDIDKHVVEEDKRMAWHNHRDSFLERKRPFLLEISYSFEMSPGLPLVIVRAAVSLPPLAEDIRSDWLRMRDTAVEHIARILQARFSQCRYTECVSDTSRVPNLGRRVFGLTDPHGLAEILTVDIVALGLPLTAIDQSTDLAGQISRIPDPRTRRIIDRLITSNFPFAGGAGSSREILSIKTLAPVITDNLPQGRLRPWLETRQFNHGLLILAGVSTETFLRFAPGHEVADQEMTLAWEADVTELPEMIFFYSPETDILAYLPEGSRYSKVCRFLRLVTGL